MNQPHQGLAIRIQSRSLDRSRNAQHVKIRRNVVLRQPKGLSNQTLDSVPFDTAADSPGNADPQSGGAQFILRNVDDQECVTGAASGGEQALEVAATLDAS